jgi:hypothetical protein
VFLFIRPVFEKLIGSLERLIFQFFSITQQDIVLMISEIVVRKVEKEDNTRKLKGRK